MDHTQFYEVNYTQVQYYYINSTSQTIMNNRIKILTLWKISIHHGKTSFSADLCQLKDLWQQNSWQPKASLQRIDWWQRKGLWQHKDDKNLTWKKKLLKCNIIITKI